MFRKTIDPIRKIKVSKNTEYKTIYNGKTFYFDCVACMNTFKENPERFSEKSFLEKLKGG